MVLVKKWMTQLTEPGPRTIATVNVLVLLGLTYTLAGMTWRLLPAPAALPEPLQQGVTPVAQVQAPAASSTGGGLSQWHLFGEVNVEATEAKPIDLPVTQLKLTLKGLMASTVPEEARAIVADPSGKEAFYKIGDKLPGNAELTEIHTDRIVLKRGTRFETLKLPKDKLAPDQFQATPSQAVVSSMQRRQRSLKDYRAALLNDPASIMDVVRLEQHDENGNFGGYRLQPGRDRELLSRFGLMPGDVVKSVNGIVLDNPAKGLGLMRELATKDTINLEIERNGVRQTFKLPVK